MSEHHGNHVSYIRVSTQRQGASGLGLDAQRKSIETFLNGGSWTLDKEFIEIESGRKAKTNPVLNEALAYCKANKATLVIARLDRLARNVSFIAGLMESGVEFVCADQPHANKFTLHIMSAMGEYEREMISKRTKAALAAAKARGVQLGNPNIGQERKAVAMTNAERYRRTLLEYRRLGLSQRRMRDALNTRNIPTPRGDGKAWTLIQVQRTLHRLGI